MAVLLILNIIIPVFVLLFYFLLTVCFFRFIVFFSIIQEPVVFGVLMITRLYQSSAINDLSFCYKSLQINISSEGLVWFVVLNATFNNISVISWR